ncbi:MAG: type II CAAX endopeptidase family protein [Methanospirillum sp.]
MNGSGDRCAACGGAFANGAALRRAARDAGRGLVVVCAVGTVAVRFLIAAATRRTTAIAERRGRPQQVATGGAPLAPTADGPRRRSPARFFALLFLITLPEYALGLVAPFSAVMVVNPLIAAAILTYRDEGRDGVGRLLGRSLDYRRIARKRWLIPVFLLMPAVLGLQYGWMRLTGAPVAALQAPVLLLPVYFLAFVLLAIGEETGWSAYALDPLQDRWGAFGAAVVIGTVWALWHLVPYALANPPLWVAAQSATTVLNRILMVWIYNNTGGSVFSVVLFHAMINMGTVPDYGFPYDPVFASAVLSVAAAAVVLLWGPRTLASYRHS